MIRSEKPLTGDEIVKIGDEHLNRVEFNMCSEEFREQLK